MCVNTPFKNFSKNIESCPVICTKNAPDICRAGGQIVVLPDYADSPCLTAGMSILGQEVVGNAGGALLPVFGLEQKNTSAASSAAEANGIKPLIRLRHAFFEAITWMATWSRCPVMTSLKGLSIESPRKLLLVQLTPTP